MYMKLKKIYIAKSQRLYLNVLYKSVEKMYKYIIIMNYKLPENTWVWNFRE